MVLSKPLSQVSLIFACGTALFSDGYANNVIGSGECAIRGETSV
jgi:hypothetical protein